MQPTRGRPCRRSSGIGQAPSLQRIKGPAAALALAGALAACSAVDRWVFGPEPDPGTRPITVTPLPDDAPYPSVTTVPPKPRLSYTVEQRRAIVDALVADQKNARYTSDVVRYRSRVDPDAAPPEPPAGVAALRGEDVIGPASAAVPGSPVRYDLEDGASSDDGARTSEPEAAQLDDGSLDDFVRGLVDETDVEPDLGTETAVLDRRNQDAAPIPGRKGKESAFERLFVWIGERLAGTAEAEEPVPGDDVENEAAGVAASGDPDQAGDAGETRGGGADLPAAKPEQEAGPRPGNLPQLKPAEGAAPPAPAPAKPEDGDQARGPLTGSSRST